MIRVRCILDILDGGNAICVYYDYEDDGFILPLDRNRAQAVLTG